MNIKRVAIVGYGLIGGSIGLALRERAPDVEVVAIDAGDSLGNATGADVVVLSAPISQNIRILETIDRSVTGEALITDTGSTKSTTVSAAERLPSRLRFVGGHPIAGGTMSGREAASADLFQGARWVLTPTARTHGDDLARLRTFVETLGATPHLMDAADHDRLLSYTSHLPQLAVSALMHVAGQAVGKRGLDFAGSGLRDSTRLATSPAPMWHDVVSSNRQNIDRALDALVAALQDLKERGDANAVERVFSDAARWKRGLDGDSRE